MDFKKATDEVLIPMMEESSFTTIDDAIEYYKEFESQDPLVTASILDRFKDDPKFGDLLAEAAYIVGNPETTAVFVSRGYDDNKHGNAALVGALVCEDMETVRALLFPSVGIPSNPRLISREGWEEWAEQLRRDLGQALKGISISAEFNEDLLYLSEILPLPEVIRELIGFIDESGKKVDSDEKSASLAHSLEFLSKDDEKMILTGLTGVSLTMEEMDLALPIATKRGMTSVARYLLRELAEQTIESVT